MLNLGLSEAELKWFEAAEKHRLKLRAEKRYRVYRPMFYRTNVYIHSIRVALLVMELAERLKGILEFDEHKAVLMALTHDDPEIITGDVQVSAKRLMTAKEREAHEDTDRKAAVELARWLPEELGGYTYLELLQEAKAKESVEAKLVDVSDKIDGGGEAFHEIFAGNTRFVTKLVTERGSPPTPPEGYCQRFQGWPEKYPALRHLFLDPLAFLFFSKRNWRALAEKGRLHTKENLREISGIPLYDFWKHTLLKRDPERQLRLLTTKLE